MEAKNIIGIKVKDGGMKGLEIGYVQQDEKDGKLWTNEYWTARKVPVGDDLMNVIKAFRYYLLDIYGYAMEDINVADCTISEVKFPGAIAIVGEYKILNGIRSAPMNTKWIDGEHEYEKMEELRNLVGQLQEEVKKYMDGKSIMSESQLVMQFYKKKGKFDEVEFEGMSDEEKKLKATEILETMGSIVIHNDDMSIGGIEESVVAVVADTNVLPEMVVQNKVEGETRLETFEREKNNVQPSFDVAVEETVVVEEVNPNSVPNLVVSEEEDEFELVITPVKAM